MGARSISSGVRSPWVWMAVLAVSLLLRVPRLSQSLWYDEMLTLTDYVDAPWQKITAARNGQYVPNNHVLHTILAKACYALGPRGELEGLGPSEALLRLPAFIAGSLLPIALGWPLRRELPWTALGVATLAAVHPWLVAFSTEARGYTLMLLLGVLATHALPDGRRRWPLGYALLLAGAMYTIPIAVLLVPAHAAAVVFLERRALPAWARGAAIAIGVSFLLYLPMLPAMVQYFRHPYEASVGYASFVLQLPSFAVAGESTTHIAGRGLWVLTALLLAVGTPLAWRAAALRPLLLTLVVLTGIGVLLPLLTPAATEVRFVAWISLWVCVAAAGLIAAAPWRVSLLGTVVLIGAGAAQTLRLPTNQPFREALQAADHLAPAGSDLMIGYLGATETAYLYGPQQTHRVLFGPDEKQWLAAEATARRETGSNPWIVIAYEDLLLRRLGEPQTRGLWLHLQRDYDRVLQLPGRISPVAVYRPHEANVPPVASLDPR